MGPNYYYQAPVAQQPPKRFSKKLIFIAAGLAVALIVAIVLTFSGGSSLGEDLAKATAKQSELAAFCRENQETIRERRLANITADAALFFASDANELTKAMQSEGVGELPKGSGEVSEDDVAKLEDAAGKGRFDQTFLKMLDQKIDAQQATMRELTAKTTDAEIQKTLNATYEHLELIRKQANAL